tara:strand:- start:163 stop:582 length:420 start_codon:yes stop_codon:yes gene_type:complete
MEDDESNIVKIQKTIDDILGVKSGLSKKRASVKNKKRELFNLVVMGLGHLNGRSIGLKHDYKIDFIEYDEMFFNVIEALMKLCFNKEQRQIIEWFLYDKFLPDGSMLILKDENSGEEIPTDTPDELWVLVQQYEKKDNK